MPDDPTRDDSKPNPVEDKLDPEKLRQACEAMEAVEAIAPEWERSREMDRKRSSRSERTNKLGRQFSDAFDRSFDMMVEADPELQRRKRIREELRRTTPEKEKARPGGEYERHVIDYLRAVERKLDLHCKGPKGPGS